MGGFLKELDYKNTRLFSENEHREIGSPES